jgi:hypothetical protein
MDPVAFAYDPLDESESWFVQVRGDVFSGDELAEALGLPCSELVDSYEVWITAAGVSLSYAARPSFPATGDPVNSYGSGTGEPAGEPLAGDVTRPLDWSVTVEDCDSGEFPTELRATWAFDEGVRASTRGCTDCDGGPLFEIPLDIDL